MLAKLQKLSGLHQAVYYQSRAWESWESLISVPGVLGLMLALYLEGSEGRRLARATMIESQGEGSQNLSKAALLPCGMARIQEFTRPNGHLGTGSQVWAIWKNLVWEKWQISEWQSPPHQKEGMHNKKTEKARGDHQRSPREITFGTEKCEEVQRRFAKEPIKCRKIFGHILL